MPARLACRASTRVPPRGGGRRAVWDSLRRPRAVRRHRALAERLCRAILDSTELAPDLVAAQLRSLDSEDHPDWGLLYEPSTRLLPQRVQPAVVRTSGRCALGRPGVRARPVRVGGGKARAGSVEVLVLAGAVVVGPVELVGGGVVLP
ncbi:hypothetical protein GCM10010440_70960 [Kitasatospora cinereorecta]